MKKRILHLLASNKFSGAENVVCTIIDNLKDEFDFVYCSLDGDIADSLKERNIKFYPMEKFSIRELNRVIKLYKPDIIHAHDYRASILSYFSSFKGEIISHLHNNCPFATSWNIKSLLYAFTINRYEKVIGVSKKVYDEAIFKNKMKDKFVKIYNFVNKDNIIKLSKDYVYEKKYDLFFIGRLTEQKNPLLYIDIVNLLKKENNNISAVMIGDGELYDACKETISLLNLNDNIEMLGFVSNPFPIIKNCRLGVMPSKWEGFGLTAIETMILNKIVLNSGVGGLGEIFSKNKQFICSNINEYADKIKNINNYELDCELINSFTNKTNWCNEYLNIYK